MGDANELNETNYTCTITNIFSRLYLASELRSHEEVNQKNLKATEDKIQPLYQNLNEYAMDQTVAKVMDCKKFNEGLKQLNARLSEQERVLREAYEKEKQLQDELAGLKTRLEELQKQKTAIDKENINLLQENKIQFAALDKAIKAYTSNFGMSLDVVAAKDYKISCKVSFKQKPTSYAVIEIDLDKEQMISFHLHGISTADETVLRNKFNQHRDTTKFLVDLRNLILAM